MADELRISSNPNTGGLDGGEVADLSKGVIHISGRAPHSWSLTPPAGRRSIHHKWRHGLRNCSKSSKTKRPDQKQIDRSRVFQTWLALRSSNLSHLL